MKKILITSGLLISSLLIAIHAENHSSGYKIINKIHLEGDSGWDYLYSDDASGHLYVSHGMMVQVVDENNGKLIGTIKGLNGVHGIAIADKLNKGFISNGRDSSVTIFNTKSFEVIARVKVTGANPDAILYDPFSNKVFTFNGRSNNSTVIDAESNKVIATIDLNGKPEFAVTNEKGKLYVNFEEESKICQINTSSLKVENVWPINPGEGPTGLAFDIENNRLFSVCGNKTMVIVDAETGKVISSLPIGERVDGAAFDPQLKCAYSSNGEGTITVVKEENKDSFNVIENIPTQKGARTIAVNRSTHHIYTPTADFGAIPEGKRWPEIIPNSFEVLDIVPIE
jgi:YVTN family beta-propeller protein